MAGNAQRRPDRGLNRDRIRRPGRWRDHTAGRHRGQVAAGGWRVTDLGQRFLNDLQALFLPVAQTPELRAGATSGAR